MEDKKLNGALEVVYNGGAMDTEVQPLKHELRPDGKPDKRRVIGGGEIKKVPLDIVRVRGVEFPLGEKVIIEGKNAKQGKERGMLNKLRALGWFTITPVEAVEVKVKPKAKPKAEAKA